MTQIEFAHAIGVSRGAVGQWETNRTQPDSSTKSVIYSIFKVNPDWLETGKGEMFIEKPVELRENSNPFIDITPEEQDLLSKALFILRGHWKGEYEDSLRKNIKSFYNAVKDEELIHGKQTHAPPEKEKISQVGQ